MRFCQFTLRQLLLLVTFLALLFGVCRMLEDFYDWILPLFKALIGA